MKKMRKNSGFTLVECVVAMAVLAVMTVALMMILNVTVKQRNANMKAENDIDSQVEKLYQSGTKSEPISNADIDFGNGIKISGAKKVYYDDPDSELQIAALEYDVGSSTKKNNDKVYGAVDINGAVTVSEMVSSKSDDEYTVQWTVTFWVNSGSDEKSLKVVLPTGATAFTGKSASFCGEPTLTDGATVMIQPELSGAKNFTSANTCVSVTFTFDIPKAYRDGKTDDDGNVIIEGYKNVVNYLTGSGSGSSASVNMST